MNQGDMFRLATQVSGLHMWIVLSQGVLCPLDTVYVASLTKIQPGKLIDYSCVLKPADHPGVITCECFVKYRDILDLRVEHLTLRPEDKLARLPEATLVKVLAGARKSKHFPPRFIRYL